jgi:hypothetical protein
LAILRLANGLKQSESWPYLEWLEAVLAKQYGSMVMPSPYACDALDPVVDNS